MIPTARTDVLNASLAILERFGSTVPVRGRFIALYLGLRRMRLNGNIALLGPGNGTSTGDIEQFLDLMWTKTHQPEPFVVLTAPFGGSTSPSAPYSTRSGVTAPGHSYPTNTWRNNFAIQKGVGCPAEPDVVANLLMAPGGRLACPHMAEDPDGKHLCGIANTAYRGEEHSIWLRITQEGYQVVDLDLPSVYDDYLRLHDTRIPIFPLIAILYGMAPIGMYPLRTAVGIPNFVEDFAFDFNTVEQTFDCDPDAAMNAEILALVEGIELPVIAPPSTAAPVIPLPPAGELPELRAAAELNTGIGAELAVAADLQECGWRVLYRGNQRGFGYDLEATRDEEVLRVEVKSSVGFTTPEMLESEWDSAERHGEEYVLAVVDFYGSALQRIWYLRDPAANAIPIERSVRVFRLVRGDIQPIATDAEFL